MVYSKDTSRTVTVTERRGLGLNVPRSLKSAVRRRLRALEDDPEAFARQTVRLRQRLKKLYAVLHIAPKAMAQAVLFDKAPAGTGLDAVRRLARLAGQRGDAVHEEAARLVEVHQLPYLVAESALGTVPEPVMLALVRTMPLDELLSRLVLIARRGRLEGRVRRAVARRLKDAPQRFAYRKLESVIRRAALDRDLAHLVVALSADQGARLTGRTAILVDASVSMPRGADGALPLGVSVIRSVDRALEARTPLDVIVYGERARVVPLARGAADLDIEAAVGGPASDLGHGTSAGAAAACLDSDVQRVVVVGDGTENRPPRLASAMLERRARRGQDPAVLLVQPHDGSRQLAVDLKLAGVAAEVFTLDRWGLGQSALVGALAGHRSGDPWAEIRACQEA